MIKDFMCKPANEVEAIEIIVTGCYRVKILSQQCTTQDSKHRG